MKEFGYYYNTNFLMTRFSCMKLQLVSWLVQIQVALNNFLIKVSEEDLAKTKKVCDSKVGKVSFLFSLYYISEKSMGSTNVNNFFYKNVYLVQFHL